MSERSELTLYVVCATFVLVLFIAAVLVRRHGHTTETAKILEAIEGGRQQASVHQDTVESELRTIRTRLRDILVRFGFMKPPL